MAKSLRCSFCSKSEKEVQKLAAGPGSLHICDECVAVCQLIMDGEGPAPSRQFEPKAWPTDRLLSAIAPVSATVDGYRQHLQKMVETLRSRDVSWAKIGDALGISRQSAWERFG